MAGSVEDSLRVTGLAVPSPDAVSARRRSRPSQEVAFTARSAYRACRPKCCATRSTRGNRATGAHRRSAVGHFSVRARPLTPSATPVTTPLAQSPPRTRVAEDTAFSLTRLLVGTPLRAHLAPLDPLARA